MKILSQNKKAYFNYHILEELEGGMVLTGQRVKSIKAGWISLQGAYVVLRKGKGILPEPYLIGIKIPAYQPKNAPKNYDPEKPIKLLLNKKEIQYLVGKTKEKGLTVIPLKVYLKNVRIKIAIGLARGKRKADKREAIKKRDAEREIRGALKNKF